MPEQDLPFHGNVLVVDDIATNRLVLVHMLKHLGFDCQEAKDGQEAFQVWQRSDPCIIFMDLQMPIVGGLESIALIRQEAERVRRSLPRFIVVTANVFEEHRRQCEQAHLDGFLPKPYSGTHLREIITPLWEQLAAG